MSTPVYCFECGQPISGDARFCPSCGTPQDGSERPPAPDLSTPVMQSLGRAGRRLERVNPGSGELASALAGHVSAPGAVAALLAAGAALAVAVVLAILLAVLPVGSHSEIVFDHDQMKLVPEVLVQLGLLFGSLLSIGAEDGRYTVQTMPLLLVLLPVLALVFVMRTRPTRSRCSVSATAAACSPSRSSSWASSVRWAACSRPGPPPIRRRRPHDLAARPRGDHAPVRDVRRGGASGLQVLP